MLARVLWEREVSKQYTPIGLGEVLQLRTFQANGEPNPLTKRERSYTVLTLQNGKLVANLEVWTPRSVLSILDGLNSVRWAGALVQLGSEQSIHLFYDWLVRLARSRPQKTDQLAQFDAAASWKLALEMRARKTFEEITGVLMKDYDPSVKRQAARVQRQRQVAFQVQELQIPALSPVLEVQWPRPIIITRSWLQPEDKPWPRDYGNQERKNHSK